MTSSVRTAALLLCLLAAGACRHAPAPADASSTAARPAASQHASATQGAGVAAANPIAVEAGLAVLRRGGSAADAAVAVQAALGLVEPQSSGIGGGAFLLHYDAQSGRVTAYDGRETAPAGATPDMFLDERGQPLPYADAVTSGRATGVPGAIAMLGLVH
jgi:gamma-glutamyltranspeptidase/glutathione hydrolase